MRGEHFTHSAAMAALMGSSPHARGAPCEGGRALSSKGIIPACAGSTFEGRAARGDLGDHPRMRGEHTSRPARLVNILA